jgi:ribosomal protein L37E
MPDTPANTPVSGKVRIADLVTCPKCGQSNAVGERYCTVCGTHLAGVVAAHVVHAESVKRQGFLGRLFTRR